MPKLTIDLLLTGADQLDAIFEGYNFPQYAITVRERGVLALETTLKGMKNVRELPSGSEIYIGRSSECHIHIPPECPESRRASRKQGRLTYGDCWCYEPLAPDNPTYFNDQPLPPSAVARITKDTILGIGPKQRNPMKYAIALKLGVQ
jgi:hypothetical protein